MTTHPIDLTQAATTAEPAGATRDSRPHPPRTRPGRSRVRRVLVALGRALVLALLVGALGGLLARLWMRLFSLVLGHPTGFSWQGTLGIVMVFTLGVLPGAIAVVVTQRRRRLLALGAGVLFLWYGTAVTAVQEDLPVAPSPLEVGALVLVGLAFLLTPLVQMWLLTRLADRRRGATA